MTIGKSNISEILSFQNLPLLCHGLKYPYRPEPTRGADRIRGEGDGKPGGTRGPQDTAAHKKNGFRSQISGGSTASPSHTMVGVAGGGGVMAAAGMLKGRVVVALYTYQGSEFGDMTFSKGDQMEIVDDTDPDW